MIARSRFLRKIRSLGYKHKRDAKRHQLYKKIGGTHYITLPKSGNIETEHATNALKQAGCSMEDIKTFLESARSA